MKRVAHLNGTGKQLVLGSHLHGMEGLHGHTVTGLEPGDQDNIMFATG